MSSRMSAICLFHKSFVYLRCVTSTTVNQDCSDYSLLIIHQLWQMNILRQIRTQIYGCMNNNFVIKFHYIYYNYKPNSKDYDERGLGVHFIQGQWYAVIQRTYF